MTKKKNSFIVQATILAAAGFLCRFLGFFFRIVITGMIGDEGNGIYGYSYYVYTFFLVISSAGLPNAISKMVSERLSFGRHQEAHQIFRISMLFAGVLGLLSTVVLIFGVGFFADLSNNVRSKPSIVLLAPAVFFVALVAVYRGFFQGMGNTAPTAFSQLIEQIVNVIVSLIMAKILMDLTKPGGDILARGSAGAVSGTLVGSVAALLILIIIYRMALPQLTKDRQKDPDILPAYSDRTILKELMRTVFPIVLGTAIFSLSNLIDAVMVKNSLGKIAGYTSSDIDALYGQLTGKYTVIITLPVSISTALSTAVIPAVASSYVQGKHEDVKAKVNASLRVTMLIALPAAFGIGALAEPIVRLLFPAYPAGAHLLTFGFAAVIFLSLAQIATGLLQAIGAIGVPVIGALFGVLLKIPLNLFLVKIPQINILGAVISTMACYVVASAIDMFFLTKYTRTKPDYTHVFVKPLIASVYMALTCYISYYLLYYLTKINIISTVFAVGIGIISYVLYMLLLEGFRESDIRMLPMGDRLAKLLFK